MYIKDFDNWNVVKKNLDSSISKTFIRVSEVRWVAFGVNVGSELDGKGASFTRPALVMHVFGSRLALVIPLSTKLKEIPGYLPFEFKGKKISVCINNLRIVSQQRIFDRLGKITSDHFKVIKVELKKYYDL